MASYADNLSRLRVAAETGSVPRDIARWAADRLAELAPAAARLEVRDTHLRQAAALVSGSRWARARRLEAEIAALARRPALTRSAGDDDVRGLVRLALEAAPAPRSRRQLLRVLE